MNKQYIYRQIHREYEDIRNRNDRILEERKQRVYKVLPAVAEADKRLKQLGAKLVKAALIHSSTSEIEDIRQEIGKINEFKARTIWEAGFAPNYLEPIYTCAKCKDTGYIGSEKCTCMKNKLMDKYYAISNLNTLLDRENFNNFNLEFYSDMPEEGATLSPRQYMVQVLEDVKKTIAPNPDNRFFNFYFYGPSGLGKTFMCSCIAKELLDRGSSVIYTTAYDLAALLERNKFRRDEFEESDTTEAVEMLFTTDLLIIDDLATENPNSFTASEFFNIINGRLINEKSTVLSSNLSPNGLSPIYSDRITSRILGRYSVFRFRGNDIRLM